MVMWVSELENFYHFPLSCVRSFRCGRKESIDRAVSVIVIVSRNICSTLHQLDTFLPTKMSFFPALVSSQNQHS